MKWERYEALTYRKRNKKIGNPCFVFLISRNFATSITSLKCWWLLTSLCVTFCEFNKPVLLVSSLFYAAPWNDSERSLIFKLVILTGMLSAVQWQWYLLACVELYARLTVHKIQTTLCTCKHRELHFLCNKDHALPCHSTCHYIVNFQQMHCCCIKSVCVRSYGTALIHW